MFKVGDLVRRIGKNCKKCLQNGVYEILKVSAHTKFIKMTHDPDRMYASQGFELVQSAAIGSSQQPPSGAVMSGPPPMDVFIEEVLEISKHVLEPRTIPFFYGAIPPSDGPKCDCGGLKTYNSMAPEVHSSWCISRQKS